MYNAIQKQRFIDQRKEEVILPNNYLENLFSKTEKVENEAEKDICNFTSGEILDFYKILSTPSHESIVFMNSQLNIYTNWCLNERLVKDGQNHFSEITSNDTLACVNQAVFEDKIMTKEQVMRYCSEMLNPKDKFIFLCLFEFGKSQDFIDIVNARYEDISGNQMKLYSGRIVTISDELAKFARESNETFDYVSPGGRQYELVENGYIIKNHHNATRGGTQVSEGRKIYTAVKRTLDYIGISKWIGPNDIVTSGKIHAINEACKKHNMPAADLMLSEHVKEIEKQFNANIRVNRAKILKKYDKYLI